MSPPTPSLHPIFICPWHDRLARAFAEGRVRFADFDAMKLMEDAKVAGEAFGFDEADFDEGHRVAGDRIMWWTAGLVGASLVAALFLM